MIQAIWLLFMICGPQQSDEQPLYLPSLVRVYNMSILIMSISHEGTAVDSERRRRGYHTRIYGSSRLVITYYIVASQHATSWDAMHQTIHAPNHPCMHLNS